MAESAQSKELHWFDPPVRALIPLDEKFHIPHRLKRTIRKTPYRITINRAFQDVMTEPPRIKATPRLYLWLSV